MMFKTIFGIDRCFGSSLLITWLFFFFFLCVRTHVKIEAIRGNDENCRILSLASAYGYYPASPTTLEDSRNYVSDVGRSSRDVNQQNGSIFLEELITSDVKFPFSFVYIVLIKIPFPVLACTLLYPGGSRFESTLLRQIQISILQQPIFYDK